MGGQDSSDDTDVAREHTVPAAATPARVDPISGDEPTLPPAGLLVPPRVERHDYAELIPVDARHYTMGPDIARGGMGRIRSARDHRLGRPVAIKELLVKTGELRARFEREARITARLQHPAIVNLLEAGVWPSGEPFFAMKLVSGQPLDKVIAQKSTLAARIGLLGHVIAAVDALAYAHHMRVIHRDLKPGNVLIGEYGETVVIDWGLAKDLADSDGPEPSVGPYRRQAVGDGETVAGAVMGTPAYMPFEQAQGAPVDERADVYALGALLYHVLSGYPPYTGKSTDDILDNVLAREPPALAARTPGVPPDLIAIVEKAMARDAADRYPSAKELASDLHKFQTGQLVGAHRYTTAQLVRRWLRRHRAPVSVAAFALVLLIAAGAWGVIRLRRERDRTELARVAAEANVAELLTEQGRQQLIAGHGDRAAVFLSAAYSASRQPGRQLRTMLAAAMRSVDRDVRILAGTDELYGAAFSPDGKRVATAGHDRKARIWDAVTGQTLVTLEGHAGSVESVAFSHDGTRVVTAGRDKTFRVWDAATGKPLLSIEGHAASVTSASFSPDDLQILTSSADHTAKLWDSRSGQMVRELIGHRDEVRWAEFSDDGESIVTASDDKSAAVWRAADGERLRDLWGHTEKLTGAAFSPDGEYVITTSLDGSARVWRGSALLLQLDGHGDFVQSAEFSGDGARIVTASFDRSAKVWDVASGRLLESLEGHEKGLMFASFSPDSSRLVTVGLDGNARVWTMASGAARPIEGAVVGAPVGYSPDGTRVVTATRGGATVWDAASGKAVQTLAGETLMSVSFNRDATRVVGGTIDGNALVWDAAGGKPATTLDGHGGAVVWVAFSPDGARVVTCSRDGSVRIWDAATGQQILALDAHPGGALSAAYRPDGAHIVTSGKDKLIRVWRADGTPERTIEGSAGLPMSVAYSPDGTRIVSAGGRADKVVRVWDAASGRLLLALEGHIDGVNHALFDPSGELIASAGDDGTTRLWDARNGKLLLIFDEAGQHVTSAAFRPDGMRLFTASWGGSTHEWEIVPEQRDPLAVAAVVRDRVPWQLVAGSLAPTVPR